MTARKPKRVTRKLLIRVTSTDGEPTSVEAEWYPPYDGLNKTEVQLFYRLDRSVMLLDPVDFINAVHSCLPGIYRKAFDAARVRDSA